MERKQKVDLLQKMKRITTLQMRKYLRKQKRERMKRKKKRSIMRKKMRSCKNGSKLKGKWVGFCSRERDTLVNSFD